MAVPLYWAVIGPTLTLTMPRYSSPSISWSWAPGSSGAIRSTSVRTFQRLGRAHRPELVGQLHWRQILHGVDVGRVALARYLGHQVGMPPDQRPGPFVALGREQVPDRRGQPDRVAAPAVVGGHRDRAASAAATGRPGVRGISGWSPRPDHDGVEAALAGLVDSHRERRGLALGPAGDWCRISTPAGMTIAQVGGAGHHPRRAEPGGQGVRDGPLDQRAAPPRRPAACGRSAGEAASPPPAAQDDRDPRGGSVQRPPASRWIGPSRSRSDGACAAGAQGDDLGADGHRRLLRGAGPDVEADGGHHPGQLVVVDARPRAGGPSARRGSARAHGPEVARPWSPGRPRWPARRTSGRG